MGSFQMTWESGWVRVSPWPLCPLYGSLKNKKLGSRFRTCMQGYNILLLQELQRGSKSVRWTKAGHKVGPGSGKNFLSKPVNKHICLLKPNLEFKNG